jgi:hypothetical protein
MIALHARFIVPGIPFWNYRDAEIQDVPEGRQKLISLLF